MPTLGNALDFAKYEGRNLRAHQLGTAPSSPVTGQLYYNTADNTLYWWNGTAWVSASGGAPSGAAGGDLSGTYPNPQIAAGVITDADVNAANKDGAVGTASMRTLGNGAAQAMPGNRTLDAITAPVASVNFNNQFLTSVADPSAVTDGANKRYVDAVASGLDIKLSARVATTAAITTLAGGAPNVVDGVTLAALDRVLVKDQASGLQNGIYTVTTLGTGSNGTWARSSDADVNAEVTPGMFVFVEAGTVNADSGWVLTTDAPIVLGTTALTFTQFSGAGMITSGAGLTKTGNTLDVGAGAGITVNADSVQVANNGITNAMLADGAVNLATADVTGALPVANGGTGAITAPLARTALAATGYYSSATHGAGTTITVAAATHGLGAKRGLLVQVQNEADGVVEIPDIAVASNGDVTVTFGVSVSANSKRVTVIG